MLRKIISWFNREEMPAYDIVFGRYTDSFKSDEQVYHWNSASKEFNERNFLKAYEHFFNYLLDDKKQNVQWEKVNDRFLFTIQQGSKFIKGEANNEKITAEARIARFDGLNMAWTRRLLEMNYSLRYSRYAIQDNNIVLKFYSSALDGSPEKLYYAIKEVALRSDKQDDLLLAEFKDLQAIDHYRLDFKEDKKEVRYTFLSNWIRTTIEKVQQISALQPASSASYLLLNLAYKIDYLITPQGKVMSVLERIQQQYMFGMFDNATERNNHIIRLFQHILNLDKESVKSEMYHVNATFGLTQPTGHESLISLLTEEEKSMKWHAESKNKEFSLNHIEYIAQYAMFNFGLRQPSRLLLNLLIELINTDYIRALGERPLYVDETGKLDQNNLQKIIRSIQDEAQKKHPAFKLDIKALDFNSVYDFGYSLLSQIKEIDYKI